MIPRSVSEATYIGGHHKEDRKILWQADWSAKTGNCVVCREQLPVAEVSDGLHADCASTLPHDVELTIKSATAMRRFELA